MRNLISLAVVAIAATVMAGAVTAVPITFDGQTVLYEYLVPDTATVVESQSVLVGPGVELNNSIPFGSDIDISSTSISFFFPFSFLFFNEPFNGPLFTDQFGTIPDIVDATLDLAVTTLVGLDSARVFFTADSVSINFAGLAGGVSTVVKLDVRFVPEPSTALLLGLGLVGLATRRRFAKTH